MKNALSIDVQRELVEDLLFRHPLPWVIEHDWTVEVTDKNGRVVGKFMSNSDARNLIEFAEEIHDDLMESQARIEKLMEDS